MTARRLMNVTVERGLTRYGTVIEAVVEEAVGEAVEGAVEEAVEMVMTIVAVVVAAARETGLGILDGAIEAVDLAV
jgi:hypothetical protein